MKTCLITGASGLLGGAIEQRLQSTRNVVALSHSNRKPGYQAVDLRDPDALRRLLADARPDEVIHCAAYRDPDFCEANRDETRRLNVEPLRVMRETLPVETKLLFVSSDYVFGGDAPPYSEDSHRSPVNFYGQSKVEGEDIVGTIPNSLILRVPVLVGAGADAASSGFITQMLTALRSEKPVNIEDIVIRFPTWVVEVADAIAFLLGESATGTVHYSGQRGATRFGWTKELGEMIGLPTDHLVPVSNDGSRKAPRPKDAHLDVTKIRGMGYSRFTDFAEVLKAILRSLGEYPDGS